MTTTNTAQCVAYLDLLGFKDALSRNADGALRLIGDYASTLDDALRDEAFPSPNAAEAPLHARTGITSFKSFVPASDSVVILSSDPALFVQQLSHFLWTTFSARAEAFAGAPPGSVPRAPRDDPRIVPVKIVSRSGIREEPETEIWNPVLFRGAICLGEAALCEVPAIIEGDRSRQSLIVGRAVVNAVRLEQRKFKGPRIFAERTLVDAVAGHSAAAVYVDKPMLGEDSGIVEVYWPMAMFNATGSVSMQEAINNGLLDVIKGVIALLVKLRADDAVRPHYEALLRLVITSAIRRYPDGREILRVALRQSETLLQPLSHSSTDDFFP